MNKLLPTLAAAVVLAAGVFAYAQDQSQTPPQTGPGGGGPGPNITFPIPELGNCGSKDECKTYCDEPANAEACINFAESKGMMKADEAAQARKFATKTGPGGCKGSECRTYCNDKSHFAECQKFAQDNGMPMPKGPPQELQGPRGPQVDEGKAEAVLAQKAGPGGCTTKDACKTYCDDPDHSAACVKFAEDNGLMTPEDAQLARKLMGQAGPGGCKGEKACNQYCEGDSHMQECLAFAEKNGLMDPQELQKAKNFVEKGGPGGCKGRQACDQFCQDPANAETCIDFAVQNGMMNSDEAAKVKEMMKNGPGQPPGQGGEDKGFGGFFSGPDGQGGQGGPGGCKSKEECDQYCKDHPDECKGGPGGPEGGGPRQPPCKSPEECKAFCESNPNQCEGGPRNRHPVYRPERGGPAPAIEEKPGGPQPGEEQKSTGPGGCTSEAECQAYCGAHPVECGAPPPGTMMDHSGENNGWSNDGSQNPPPQEGQNFQGMMPGQGGDFQGPPPGGEPGGPAAGPTSSNLVAAVYSIVARLLGY